MPSPRLIILGSSAGIASAHRASASYLLDLGDHGILIDCGDGATANFLKAGYRPAWVSDILISHTHADHICGLPYFIQQRHQSRTTEPLTIHCPAETIAPLENLLILGHLYPEWMRFEIGYLPIEPFNSRTVQGVHTTALPTSHLDRQRDFAVREHYPDPGECFAFCFEINGRSLVYSADLGSLDDLNRAPNPIEWLLIEVSHIALEDLWPWAESRQTKQIILTHYTDDFDQSQLAPASKYTSARVTMAQDLLVFDLNPP